MPPLTVAFKEVDCPGQISVFPEILTVGLFRTETAVVQFALHPLESVTLTLREPEEDKEVVIKVTLEARKQ